MKIFLIHGDDTERSHKRFVSFLNEAKKRGWEIVFLDETSLGLAENINSSSLFGSERFFIHRKFDDIKKGDLEWLNNNYEKNDGNLVIFSESVLPKTKSSKLPKSTKIEEFKLPVILWKFLDSFFPGNSKNILNFLQEILRKNAGELVIGLLAKHLKDLYSAKKHPSVLSYPSWRITKLKNQANRYKNNELEEIIDELANIDVKSKIGGDLGQLLDFAIISKLK